MSQSGTEVTDWTCVEANKAACSARTSQLSLLLQVTAPSPPILNHTLSAMANYSRSLRMIEGRYRQDQKTRVARSYRRLRRLFVHSQCKVVSRRADVDIVD